MLVKLELTAGQSFEGMGIRRKLPAKVQKQLKTRTLPQPRPIKNGKRISWKAARDSYTQEILDGKTDIPQITITDAGIGHFINQAKAVLNGKKSSLKGGTEDVGDMLNHLSIRLEHGQGKLSVASCKKLLALWDEAFDREGSSSMQDVLGAGLPGFIKYYLKSTTGPARATALKTLFIEHTHLLTNAYEDTSIKKLITSDLYNAALAKAISSKPTVSGYWSVVKLLLLGTYGGLRYADVSTKKSFVKTSLSNISRAVALPLKHSYSTQGLLPDVFKSAVRNHGASNAIAAFSDGLATNTDAKEEVKNWIAKSSPKKLSSSLSILDKFSPKARAKTFKSKASSVEYNILSEDKELLNLTYLRQDHLDLEDEPQILAAVLSEDNSFVELAFVVEADDTADGFEATSKASKLTSEQRNRQRNVRKLIYSRKKKAITRTRLPENTWLSALVILMLDNAKTASDLTSIASVLDARNKAKTTFWYYGLAGNSKVLNAFIKAAKRLTPKTK
jgi:hypothetical protein